MAEVLVVVILIALVSAVIREIGRTSDTLQGRGYCHFCGTQLKSAAGRLGTATHCARCGREQPWVNAPGSRPNEHVIRPSPEMADPWPPPVPEDELCPKCHLSTLQITKLSELIGMTSYCESCRTYFYIHRCQSCKENTSNSRTGQEITSQDGTRWSCCKCRQRWALVECPTCQRLAHIKIEWTAWKCLACESTWRLGAGRWVPA
jgi:hypothetical protein